MKPFICICSVSLIFLLIGCNNPRETSTAAKTIDFGNLEPVKATQLMSACSYVALESSENSLLGNIRQLEISEGYIYILDDKMNTFNVFSMDGKFIKRLEGLGNGPGEFISPHSFWIDKRAYVLILDRQLNRLLKYGLADLDFVEDITLPSPSPLSFAAIPGQETYIYYYPLRQEDVFSGKQFVVADGNGTVARTFYDAPPAGKILHGCSANFYLSDGNIRTYPYFSNQICELKGDSLGHCYELFWGNLQLPPIELFQKYETSGEVMKEILTGEDDWIRLLYVYETEQALAVKYYIKRNLYLSIWNKKKNNVFNVQGDKIVDDFGFGGKFPLPIATCDSLFVGAIYPFDVTMERVKDKRLMDLLDGQSEENNPVLVFYN